MPDPSLTYAAYGSNLHPERLGRRIASARPCGTAFLDGWSLAFRKRGKDGSGKASLLAGGDGVHVALYSISPDDRPILDSIEHAGIGYEAMTVDMPDHGRCFTYVATDAYIDDELRPFCWYRELVIAGARFQDFPTAYVDAIHAVRVKRDPDDARRRRNHALLGALGAD